MSERPDSRHYVRQVVLPSGKTIDVVYFEEHPEVMGPGPAAPAAPAPAIPDVTVERDDLHVCESCSSELVYPVEWEEAGATHWEVTLRCPNCEWTSTGVYAQRSVERFDEELDRGTESLVSDLRSLMHANMEEEIERFVGALDADALLPEDFGRPGLTA